MKTAIIKIEDNVNELLAVLDRNIEQLQKSLSRLDELRSLVVKRDDDSLCKLLETIQCESNGCKADELKRQLLREELANSLECGAEQITLSRLEAELSGEKKAEITERKRKLQTLIEKLRRECLSTSMFLSDCARFNSLLLKSILRLGQTGTITYSREGSTERPSSAAFMNLQF